MDGLPAGIGAFNPNPLTTYDTPEEAIFRFETYGENATCPDPKFGLYKRGKANRDFWTKEKGWWDKEALYVAEMFLVHLTIECFQELFEPWWPRVHIVREFFDNNYTQAEYLKDVDRYYKYGLEAVPGGLRIVSERDYGQNKCTYHKGCKSDSTVPEVPEVSGE
jgi:hypothetical protein